MTYNIIVTNKKDMGEINGLCRAYAPEFVKDGIITLGSCIFINTSIEDYYEKRIADWGNLGYTPFEIESNNGYVYTGNMIFKGYYEEYIDIIDGRYEECVREVDMDIYFNKYIKV